MSSAKGSSFLTKAAMEAEEKPMPTLQASETDTKPALNVSPSKPRLQPPNASSSDGHHAAVDVHNKEDSFKANKGNVVDDDNDDYLDSFPPGFRFCPHDEELVLYYLKKKVMNEPLPENRIMEVNLYRHNPDKLAEQYKQYGEKEWYFFTPRDKKYRNGTRPNRAAGDGYWKATGADKAVTFKGHTIGFRKALVFYKGKPPKGDKTNWIMHEYRVNDPPPCKRVYNDMRLDDWVLCRIYKKADKSTSRTRVSDEDATSSIYHEDSNELSNMDFDYNSVADSMDDYSNALGSFMHQSFLDGSSFSNIQQNQIHSWSIGTQYSRRQDDIWSVANLDFASQLDFYGVPTPSLINLDNILPLDPPKPNSRINDSN